MFRIVKDRFVVIGKEGSTADDQGFIQRLWRDANSHFGEIAHLAKRDAQGNLMGIWGGMTDHSRSFQPWENGFCHGLYLAGVECVDEGEAPIGWTKWVVPAFEYVAVENQAGAFEKGLSSLAEQGLSLAGAVQEYTAPDTGREYLYFPIRAIESRTK